MKDIRIGSIYYSSGDCCIVCPYGGVKISNACGEKCINGTPEDIANEEDIEFMKDLEKNM